MSRNDLRTATNVGMVGLAIGIPFARLGHAHPSRKKWDGRIGKPIRSPIRKSHVMIEAAPLAKGRVRYAVRSSIRPKQELHFRTVRPSLLDLRFCGDACILRRADGRAVIYLGDYGLTSLEAGAVDLPSLNAMFNAMRHRRPRSRSPKPGKEGKG
jgi:hypothetical protein